MSLSAKQVSQTFENTANDEDSDLNDEDLMELVKRFSDDGAVSVNDISAIDGASFPSPRNG